MKYVSLLCVIAFYSNVVTQPIDIRPASMNELPSVLELDERVTYEFFKPLYTALYQHLNVNRDVDKDLQEELVGDAENFPQLIDSWGAERLQIAWDVENNIPCGLLVFSQHAHNEVLLDLLLVDKNYRGKGIGKKLVRSVVQIFKDIKAMIVYPIQFNNDDTLKFYESLGFKNFGLASEDKINSHGIRHSDMYYYFRLDMNEYLLMQ
jgi:Acetyltransferase (GNAT) family.